MRLFLILLAILLTLGLVGLRRTQRGSPATDQPRPRTLSTRPGRRLSRARTIRPSKKSRARRLRFIR